MSHTKPPISTCVDRSIRNLLQSEAIAYRDLNPILPEIANRPLTSIESSIMLDRRKMLQGMAAGAGAAFGLSLFPDRLLASPTRNTTPKRVVFFMQNQGFDPETCLPAGMNSSGSLAKVKLPEPINALEPYKERLHIINGLHGLHTSPSHSAFFGRSAAIAAGTACRLVHRRSIMN